MKTEALTKIERFVFATLYRLKIYKADLVPDGKTDNTRAMQTRLDVNKPDVLSGLKPGIYIVSDTLKS